VRDRGDGHPAPGVGVGVPALGAQEGLVVVVDDMIASGTTLQRAARACRNHGALAVCAVATHGDFSAKAPQVLADAAFDLLLVTDTIDCARLRVKPADLGVVPTTSLVAEAIRRLHDGGSVSALGDHV